LDEIYEEYFTKHAELAQGRLFELFEKKFHLRLYLDLLRKIYFFKGKFFLNSFLVELYEQVNQQGPKDIIIKMNNLL